MLPFPTMPEHLSRLIIAEFLVGFMELCLLVDGGDCFFVSVEQVEWLVLVVVVVLMILKLFQIERLFNIS